MLNVYAAWEALKPAWFTDTLKAAIPDNFMPAESLRQENARRSGGRRHTLDDMGPLRRITLAHSAGSAADDDDGAAPQGPLPNPLTRVGSRLLPQLSQRSLLM